MNLADTQRLFWEALHGRAEVERLTECFAGTSELPAGERVEIYADMYGARLVDALREEFPKLAALLGDEDFHSLAEAYVHAYPSESHDIGNAGLHLEAFLREHPGDRSDLADLAALEWARSDVFDESNSEPISAAALQIILPERFPEMRLRLIPAVRVLRLDHDAASVWRAIEDEEDVPAPEETSQAVAVWRAGFDVLHAPVELDEAIAIEAAVRGETFATICEAFTDSEDPASAALAAVASWFNEGWIVSVD